jgi:hypothetical protein
MKSADSQSQKFGSMSRRSSSGSRSGTRQDRVYAQNVHEGAAVAMSTHLRRYSASWKSPTLWTRHSLRLRSACSSATARAGKPGSLLASQLASCFSLTFGRVLFPVFP